MICAYEEDFIVKRKLCLSLIGLIGMSIILFSTAQAKTDGFQGHTVTYSLAYSPSKKSSTASTYYNTTQCYVFVDDRYYYTDIGLNRVSSYDSDTRLNSGPAVATAGMTIGQQDYSVSHHNVSHDGYGWSDAIVRFWNE
jgi:hypothetical protein